MTHFARKGHLLRFRVGENGLFRDFSKTIVLLLSFQITFVTTHATESDTK